MPRVICPIALSADRWLPFYRGELRALLVRSLDGRSVQLPAASLQRFVDMDGLNGIFVVDFTDGGKLVRIERLAIPDP